MHWQETEISVIEIEGRFFALNGWDGVAFNRCWECEGREGERFSQMVGHNSYRIFSLGNGRYEIAKNRLIGEEEDIKVQMYKLLVPYSGMAMTTQGEILRAVVWLEHSQTQRLINPECATSYLKAVFSQWDEEALSLLGEVEAGDFTNFAKLKSLVEGRILQEYEAGLLQINEEDFEDF